MSHYWGRDGYYVNGSFFRHAAPLPPPDPPTFKLTRNNNGWLIERSAHYWASWLCATHDLRSLLFALDRRSNYGPVFWGTTRTGFGELRWCDCALSTVEIADLKKLIREKLAEIDVEDEVVP